MSAYQDFVDDCLKEGVMLRDIPTVGVWLIMGCPETAEGFYDKANGFVDSIITI